jgi:hypothetical protein
VTAADQPHHTLTTDERAELRQVAERAAGEFNDWYAEHEIHHYLSVESNQTTDVDADVAHIIAWTPQRALRLLDALAAADARGANLRAALSERVTAALPMARWMAEADRDEEGRNYALVHPDALLALINEAIAVRAVLDWSGSGPRSTG